jgi:hypothetical protein
MTKSHTISAARMWRNLISIPVFGAMVSVAFADIHPNDGGAIDIGKRRELFPDNLLVARLAGSAQRVSHKPLRLLFVMKDADLYSIKFEETK